MRFALLTNVVSPHQLPLAKEIVRKFGEVNYRYIYTLANDDDHKGLAWNCEVPRWCIMADTEEADEWLENADILLSGLREFELFEHRAAKGLTNYYMSERWLKPPIGIWRLAHPKYFGYARRLCKMMSEGKLTCLPIGIHAARDMARLYGLMHGDLRCLLSAPELEFERKPGGNIWLKESRMDNRRRVEKRLCLEQMRMWGYFVESSNSDAFPVQKSTETERKIIKVLWVGRLLNLKRVDTIVRAVSEHANLKRVDSSLPDITLDIYGNGPEEARLRKMAYGNEDLIQFHPPVSIGEVRRLMREHDVYVFSSNGYEGWGAVVSEALEEGMKVIGTFEAGACATILPENCLFHAGDWRALLRLLEGAIPKVGIGEWTAKKAAELANYN